MSKHLIRITRINLCSVWRNIMKFASLARIKLLLNLGNLRLRQIAFDVFIFLM